MKKGFTCGAFDLCHSGHMLMFKECKQFCDYLIVGLQTDPTLDRANKNKPIQTLEERKIQLEGIKYIDEIVIYNTEQDLYNLLAKNDIGVTIRIIGEDWRGKEYTGHDLPLEVAFNSRTHSYSTTSLRERIAKAEAEKKKTTS